MSDSNILKSMNLAVQSLKRARRFVHSAISQIDDDTRNPASLGRDVLRVWMAIDAAEAKASFIAGYLASRAKANTNANQL